MTGTPKTKAVVAPLPFVEAPPLALREAARRALAEAKSIDEVKLVRDWATRLRLYAQQAKDRDMEADAVELRMRATRCLAEMIDQQRDRVGLNSGAAGGGGKDGPRGSLVDPRDLRPTLASQGIDKHLAHHARVIGALSDEQFEQRVAEARDAAGRVVLRVVNAAVIEQERERYRARTYEGCTVADLEALAASGFRAGVIYTDAAWPFYTFSKQGRQRSPDRHYDEMSVDQIKAMAPVITALAAPNCALLSWGTWPDLLAAVDVIRAWEFIYKTAGFVWVKTTLSGDGLKMGMGFTTRANTEYCLLSARGAPLRLDAGVHQVITSEMAPEVIVAPVGDHSEKPEEVARRIEALYPGPYLELFARRSRPGWVTWGNEIPRGEMAPPDPAAGPPPGEPADAAASSIEGRRI